jgi:hypothetical protein
MAHDTGGRVIEQHALNAFGRFWRGVHTMTTPECCESPVPTPSRPPFMASVLRLGEVAHAAKMALE